MSDTFISMAPAKFKVINKKGKSGGSSALKMPTKMQAAKNARTKGC